MTKNAQDFRDAIDDLIEQASTTPEETARLELVREYVTNADFRERLQDYSFKATYSG